MEDKMEDRIKKLEEKLLIIEIEKKSERKWVGLILLFFLAWLGITSFYQVPGMIDKWLDKEGFASLKQNILDLKKASENGITLESIKTYKISIIDKKGQERIELSVGSSKDNDLFREPAIILFDSLGKVRGVYGLEERGTGHLAFRSESGLNDIVVTNSKKWGINKPNFLRRPNDDNHVETVFKDKD